MANKDFEAVAYELLKREFDSVDWISKKCPASIHFKCRKEKDIFYIVAFKNKPEEKSILTHEQQNVDAVVMLINNEPNIVWKKDFETYVTIQKFTNPTTIRVSMSLKKRLDSLKKYRQESYNDLIESIIIETFDKRTKLIEGGENGVST